LPMHPVSATQSPSSDLCVCLVATVDDFARKRKAAQNAVTAITDVIAKHHRRGAVSYSYHNKVELVGGQNIDPAAGGNPLMGMPGMI